MHRPFALEPIMHKRATLTESVFVHAPDRELKTTNCPRRRLCQEIFGHGFDSHHLHQLEKTALCGLFYLAKSDGCEKPYERISSLHSKARVSDPRDILFALAEPATRGPGSILTHSSSPPPITTSVVKLKKTPA